MKTSITYFIVESNASSSPSFPRRKRDPHKKSSSGVMHLALCFFHEGTETLIKKSQDKSTEVVHLALCLSYEEEETLVCADILATVIPLCLLRNPSIVAQPCRRPFQRWSLDRQGTLSGGIPSSTNDLRFHRGPTMSEAIPAVEPRPAG